ncbi:hypothetical protein ACLKA7_011700 [Drosophila subpalustris]
MLQCISKPVVSFYAVMELLCCGATAAPIDQQWRSTRLPFHPRRSSRKLPRLHLAADGHYLTSLSDVLALTVSPISDPPVEAGLTPPLTVSTDATGAKFRWPEQQPEPPVQQQLTTPLPAQPKTPPTVARPKATPTAATGSEAIRRAHRSGVAERGELGSADPKSQAAAYTRGLERKQDLFFTRSKDERRRRERERSPKDGAEDDPGRATTSVSPFIRMVSKATNRQISGMGSRDPAKKVFANRFFSILVWDARQLKKNCVSSLDDNLHSALCTTLRTNPPTSNDIMST